MSQTQLLKVVVVLSAPLLAFGCQPQQPATQASERSTARAPDASQQWIQSIETDRMRGIQTNVSTLASRREDEGATREQMFVVVSIAAADGRPKVSLKIEPGQFHCGPRVCDLFISFNSGAAEMFVFELPRDGRGYEQVDSRESERLIGSLRSASRFAVEAVLLSVGTRQFFFQAEPLK